MSGLSKDERFMMGRLDNNSYVEDVRYAASSINDWSMLEGATVAIAGATGMIGTFLVDVLMSKALDDGLTINVLALGRDKEKARDRFPYFDDHAFSFEEIDVSNPGAIPSISADVVVHLASATHPRAYAKHPIGTITSNVMGLTNLLEYSCRDANNPARFLFASSVEVYGENRGDVKRFDESYLGYINCNTLRAGYPEAKRCGEALCQAYAAERGVPIFLPRLPRVYGPTVLPNDSKAISQFINKAVTGEDIVLKSEGAQVYSYLYVADVVAALLHILTQCDAGVAYNVSDERSDVSLRDLASMLAGISGTRVVFELPDELERLGYSTATKAMLNPTRIHATGWSAHYDLQSGLERTVMMLKSLHE